MKTIKIDNKEIEISDESYNAFKEQFMKEDYSRWRPNNGEVYYYITSGDYIYSRIWVNDKIDNFRYANKNIYKTEEEAKRALEILNILNENEYDFSEDEWQNGSIGKYYIFYDFNDNTIDTSFNFRAKYSLRYFKNQETVQKVSDLIGDEDYKKYIVFGGIK